MRLLMIVPLVLAIAVSASAAEECAGVGPPLRPQSHNALSDFLEGAAAATSPELYEQRQRERAARATYDALLASSQFVQTLEQRQGLKIACIEEIAFFKGFIGAGQLEILANGCAASGYGQYLLRVLQEHRATQGVCE